MLYLLDTNILLAYARLSKLYLSLEASLHPWTLTPDPIISVVSVAEIRTLATEFAWGPAKRYLMEQVLERFVAVPIPFGNIVDSDVQVSEHSRHQGRTIGKNDLWIAATAISTGATLLTTDKDFDHLHPLLLNRHWINPAA